MTNAPAPPDSSIDQPLVLVVDDSEDNRFLYRMTFEGAGYRVLDAEDGEDALAKIAKVRPAVIVMDLTMPRMDGWEATRRIKADETTRDIAVVVVTGSGTKHELDRAWAAGADDVCTKPCNSAVLLARVRALFALSRARTATP